MKTVLLTGATGALGNVTADAFAAAGWNVASIKSPRSGSVSAPGTYVADLSDESQVATAVTSLRNDGFRPSAVVLIAGGFEGGGIAETDHAAIQRMLDMNFYSAWHVIRSLSQVYGPISGLNIILIGARAARDANAGKSAIAYAFAKSLLFSMTALLNADKASLAARVTLLVPGIIDTPANRSWSPDADFSKWSKPEEMARIMCAIVANDETVSWKPIIEC